MALDAAQDALVVSDSSGHRDLADRRAGHTPREARTRAGQSLEPHAPKSRRHSLDRLAARCGCKAARWRGRDLIRFRSRPPGLRSQPVPGRMSDLPCRDQRFFGKISAVIRS